MSFPIVRFLLAGALSIALCQCRCIRSCMAFFKGHASTGHNSRVSGNLPSRPMTWEDFYRANAHRGLPDDLLRTRFQVADANNDGLLTPAEIERHRAIAAQNKARGR